MSESQNFTQKKVLVSDFDGVFVEDSDALFKPNAWKTIFSPWTDTHEQLFKGGNERFGNGNPGGRKEIIAYMLNGLGITADAIPEEVERLNTIFTTTVNEAIEKAGLVIGAREMLETLKAEGLTLYLNSGTATPALRKAAFILNIDSYFTEMLGSTKEPYGGNKVENLARAMEQEGVEKSQLVMIGDGEPDRLAAEVFGCRFIGVANRWNRWEPGLQTFPVARTLSEIPKLASQ